MHNMRKERKTAFIAETVGRDYWRLYFQNCVSRNRAAGHDPEAQTVPFIPVFDVNLTRFQPASIF